jgi:class 3 adenylate cyclase
VDLGDWSIRNWRLVSLLTTLLLVGACGLVGLLSGYDARVLPALGGPNGMLYDVTLRLSQPWRRDIPTVPVAFIAVDDASLATPELSALPRPLFQPIWARLIDGLLDAGVRRIAFDVVFGYAGADFHVGAYVLPDYDRGLIDSLVRGRERIVLGRFPGVPPAAAFVQAIGRSRVGALDLQLESDGRVRSTAPLVRLHDGRLALGFAALGAGWNIRQASSSERILMTPRGPLADVPTYSLATLLACMGTSDGAAEVHEALQGYVAVVGTAVLGEDEHRGPTRFLGHAAPVRAASRCAPERQPFERPDPESAPGALLQIAAIQSAASERPVTLAPAWLRLSASAVLALLFALLAFRDESALTIGERDVVPFTTIAIQLLRTALTGLVGPAAVGLLVGAAAFVLADLWLPMGYPILATNLAFGVIVGERSVRHRAIFRRLYRTAGRYLPPARLVTLARTHFADPGEGQEREVSILLVDLVGFTSFSNRPDLTASQIVRIANQYFTLMHATIDRHDGCSDKFLGDAVLAFWNGLSDEPDHAIKAVAAAQEIMQAVSDVPGLADHRLAARAVVCSGRVYVGDLGAKERSNFTIIGPAVNETFRLEKLPDLYGVPLLVAASTAQLLMSSKSAGGPDGMLVKHALIRLDDVALKGFAKPESIYGLVPRDDPGLAKFAGARKALDRHMVGEALACLSGIENGMLKGAAKVLRDRYAAVNASSKHVDRAEHQ